MTIDVLMIGLRHIHTTQGGIETHVRHLAEELDRLGVRVAIAVRPQRRTNSATSFEVDAARAGDSRATKVTGHLFRVGQMTGKMVHRLFSSAAGSWFGERHSQDNWYRVCGEYPLIIPSDPDWQMEMPRNADDSHCSDMQRGSTGIRLVTIWSPPFAAFDAIVHSFLCVLYAAVIRPRIVHVHAIGPSLVVPLARLLGLRVVATHHGEDYLREKWGAGARFLLRCGEVMQAGFANRILCVSQPLTERLKRRYRRDYTYIPNGIAVNGPALPTTILDELGLKPHRYILTVGRIVPEKRHFDLMAAFAGARMPGMKLVIVGLGENGSRYAVEVAKAAAMTPGVVMAGFREGSDLDVLYTHAALFALPSSHEGLPIALLEAMAQGSEVLVSDIEAHRALRLPATAYHALGDIAQLSDGLRFASRRAALPGGRRDWSARLSVYRWPRIARQVLEVFRSVDARIGAIGEATPRNMLRGRRSVYVALEEPETVDLTPRS